MRSSRSVVPTEQAATFDSRLGHLIVCRSRQQWIGSVLGTRQYALGVDRFGESDTIADFHELTGIDSGSIVNSALIAVAEH